MRQALALRDVRVYTRTMYPYCYCIKLRNASRRLTSIYDEALAPFGVNITQFSQLRRIRRLQPVSLTDLAKSLELDRSTVGRNTKVLERMGLVFTAPGEDLRESTLAITDSADALLDAAAPVWNEVQARVEAKIGGADLDRLLKAVDTI
jgi:DNA-binding MarR family transcriptional regulator